MKLLLINSFCGIGSSGKQCMDIATSYEKDGYEVKIAYGRGDYVPEECYEYAVRIGSDLDNLLHKAGTRLTDRHGTFSKRATKSFLEWADEFDPDMVWLHNIHGYYLNYRMLFDWIKKRPDMKVRWTIHDCWPITGHCLYFSYEGCDKWTVDGGDKRLKDAKFPGCSKCPQRSLYPGSWFIDASAENYADKKKTFTGVKDMAIIASSAWQKEIISHSFLNEYPVQVVYNKVDTNVFKPTQSDFRSKHGIPKGAFMILGVANVWGPSKGLNDFIELAARTGGEPESKNRRFSKKVKIVLIGLSEAQIKKLPSGIVALPRIKSSREMAGIYSAADVVVNPTYEADYPTVILEAEACGTPVITYDTGGCSEAIHISGSKAIPQGIDSLEKEILHRVT